MSSSCVLTYLPTGESLTTNSLLQILTLNYLAYLGTDRSEGDVLLLLFAIIAVQICLYAKPLLSNGCRVVASFEVIA
jgi:hypothetical protein